MNTSPRARLFAENTEHLTGVAYRMLGSLTESEDVVQDAWLRWSDVRLDKVENPQAFLTRTVSRLCLDRLRRRRVEKLNYTGPWLPEPMPTEEGPDDVVDVLESVNMALMVTLESLTPLERAVFILGEAFDYAHAEIAELLDISQANSRQLLRRARQRVTGVRRAGDRETLENLVNAFFTAALEGDNETLHRVLAEDVVAYSDGGGRASAALIPLVGPERVITVFSHLAKKELGKLRFVWMPVNHSWGLCMMEGDTVHSVHTFDVEGGRIRRCYTMRNPEKLRAF